MDYSETLLTIAELAVALAGFAGLITVIGRDRHSKSTVADALRLRMMLELALTAAAFALLPLPFIRPEIYEPELWRLASGIHIIAGIGITGFGVYRYRTVGPDPDPRSISVSVSGLAAIAIFVNLYNVLGVDAANAFYLYLASLLLSLGVAGLKFIAVAGSIFDVAES